MNQPSDDDCLAAAIEIVNQKFAERTGRDIAAEVLTPAQQAEVRAGAKRARGRH